MKWTDYDCRLSAEKLLPCCLFFFSSRSKHGVRELTECSKLTCFAKRMLDMVPGAVVSEIGARCRLLSGIVGVYVSVRSIASWGREKIAPIRRIQTPKKRKKPSSTHQSKFTNESQSRTEADDRSTNCYVHACMHYAQLQCTFCLVNSVELGTSNDSSSSSCSSN